MLNQSVNLVCDAAFSYFCDLPARFLSEGAADGIVLTACSALNAAFLGALSSVSRLLNQFM
jgi:hypothetical protein